MPLCHLWKGHIFCSSRSWISHLYQALPWLIQVVHWSSVTQNLIFHIFLDKSGFRRFSPMFSSEKTSSFLLDGSPRSWFPSSFCSLPGHFTPQRIGRNRLGHGAVRWSGGDDVDLLAPNPVFWAEPRFSWDIWRSIMDPRYAAWKYTSSCESCIWQKLGDFLRSQKLSETLVQHLDSTSKMCCFHKQGMGVYCTQYQLKIIIKPLSKRSWDFSHLKIFHQHPIIGCLNPGPQRSSADFSGRLLFLRKWKVIEVAGSLDWRLQKITSNAHTHTSFHHGFNMDLTL